MTREEAEAIIALVEATADYAVDSGQRNRTRAADAREKLLALAPAPPRLHYMRHGTTPCGLTSGLDPGWAWSSLWKDVDCPECLKADR